MSRDVGRYQTGLERAREHRRPLPARTRRDKLLGWCLKVTVLVLRIPQRMHRLGVPKGRLTKDKETT